MNAAMREVPVRCINTTDPTWKVSVEEQLRGAMPRGSTTPAKALTDEERGLELIRLWGWDLMPDRLGILAADKDVCLVRGFTTPYGLSAPHAFIARCPAAFAVALGKACMDEDLRSASPLSFEVAMSFGRGLERLAGFRKRA